MNENIKKQKRKWWLHPMDPENLLELSDQDRRNAKSFNHWLLIWMILFFGVANGIDPVPGGVNATPVWRILLAASPLVAGLFLVRAFKRLFGETRDELLKQIHQKALIVGFMFAFFIGMGFILTSVIIGESMKAGPIIFSGLLVGYLISIVQSYRKYNA